MKTQPHPMSRGAAALAAEAVQAAHARQDGPASLRAHPLSRLEIGLPHPIASIALRDLAQGRSLRHAQQAGVRYLVRTPQSLVGAVDLGLDEDGAEADHVVALVTSSARIDAIARALDEAGPSASRPGALSLLICRALKLEALVLRADRGEPTVLPIAPERQRLERSRYGEKEFLVAIAPEARRIQDVYDQSSFSDLVG